MQTCKNCQFAIPDNARICANCGMPVSRDDAARRRLFMTLRQAALPASLAATVSLGSYVILSTLMLMYVMLGLFLRPSVAISASPPALIVTPLTVDFGKVLMGDKPPQSRILTVNNRSSSLLHWIADTTKASWLKLDTNSGDIGPHMQKLVKATMDISGLSPRSVPYSTIISFHANSISTLVQMRVTVLAPGKLCIRPDHLNFGSLEQGTTGRLHVTVGNCGAQPLSWSIATGKESWVSTYTDHGTIDPEMQQDVQVTIDTSQLTPSSMAYSASLTFSSVQGSQIVPITVTVTSQVSIPQQAPGWSITPTSLTPDNSQCLLGSDHTWTCKVTLTENANAQGAINWTSASNLGATFDPPSGGLRPNEHQQITISSITCQNDTFTFYGAEAETPIAISWSCTPPCIEPDLASLSMTMMYGQPGKAQIVTFTNCGPDMGNVTIMATTSDGASWLNTSPINTQSLGGPLASNMRQMISVSITSTNLLPGVYQGTIAASITTSSGTDMATTNVTLTVSPCFTVDHPSLSYTFPGQEETQAVTFTNCGTSEGDVSISSSTSDDTQWLSIDAYDSQLLSGPLGAGETDTIYFNVSGEGLIAGSFQGQISAALTTNGITTSIPVNVTLTVLSPPHMTVSSPGLDFGTISQGQSAKMSLTISNTGGQTLNWSALPMHETGVTLDTSTDMIQANGQQTISVTVDTTYQEPASYSTTLIIDSNADNSPVQVAITWEVVSPPNMNVNPTYLRPGVCSSNGTPTATPTSVTITNSGGGTLTWTVGTPSATWLTVSSNYGNDGPGKFTTLEFDVDPVAWYNGSNSATVDITSSNGQTVTITVTPQPCIE